MKWGCKFQTGTCLAFPIEFNQHCYAQQTLPMAIPTHRHVFDTLLSDIPMLSNDLLCPVDRAPSLALCVQLDGRNEMPQVNVTALRAKPTKNITSWTFCLTAHILIQYSIF